MLTSGRFYCQWKHVDKLKLEKCTNMLVQDQHVIQQFNKFCFSLWNNRKVHWILSAGKLSISRLCSRQTAFGTRSSCFSSQCTSMKRHVSSASTASVELRWTIKKCSRMLSRIVAFLWRVIISSLRLNNHESRSQHNGELQGTAMLWSSPEYAAHEVEWWYSCSKRQRLSQNKKRKLRKRAQERKGIFAFLTKRELGCSQANTSLPPNDFIDWSSNNGRTHLWHLEPH